MTFINLILIEVSKRPWGNLTWSWRNLTVIFDISNIYLLKRHFILKTSIYLLKWNTLIFILIFLFLNQRLFILILRSWLEWFRFLVIYAQISLLNVFNIWSVRWFLINLNVLKYILQAKIRNWLLIIQVLKMGLSRQFLKI